MEPSTYKRIKQLITDSGLIQPKAPTQSIHQNFNFENEIILITGAAGSIGCELAQQLLFCNYKKIILLDCAESPLYNLIKAFENENALEFLLLNINDENSMEWLFQVHKPTLIFHAAAYKHVPLMEAHPYEAVKTNCFATKFLADLAIKYAIKKFVFISSDKAVNPISVMGMTKRIAEHYLIALSNQNTTQFSIARFGNIMGSNGSVLPLFIKQIEDGKPVTITHEHITRYFIDKHKACSLILHLATFSIRETTTFTFAMGIPIKLMDVAETLISLYAENEKNIEIKITGLRPGEKFHEELVSKEEDLLKTENPDILKVIKKNRTTPKPIDFDRLKNCTPYLTPHEIKTILEDFI